jgi:hypothetical protein
LLFLKDNGLIIISIVGALVLIGVIVYLIASPRRTVAPVANAEEPANSERVVD